MYLRFDLNIAFPLLLRSPLVGVDHVHHKGSARGFRVRITIFQDANYTFKNLSIIGIIIIPFIIILEDKSVWYHNATLAIIWYLKKPFHVIIRIAYLLFVDDCLTFFH